MDLTSSVVLSRLTTQTRALDVIAHNVANIGTPGFKGEHVQFADWLEREPGNAGAGGEQQVAFTQDRATYRDVSPGPITQTGNPLDLAITGEGFFTVQTPAGPRLTRAGHFALLADGTVATAEGDALLDTAGRPIRLAPNDTDIRIAGDGTVTTPNGTVGRIDVVAPNDPSRLVAEGDLKLRADGGTTTVAQARLIQGAAEGSNVQPIAETTSMIEATRQFQFAVQFLQAESDRQSGAIDKLLPTAKS